MIDLAVLAVLNGNSRCRILATNETVVLHGVRYWDAYPGAIVTVTPAKEWTFGATRHMSGKIENVRLDVKALGLTPLRLENQGMWDPNDVDWGVPATDVDRWTQQTLLWGPRPEYEMEQALPGLDLDVGYDPVGEAADLLHAGSGDAADKILNELCAADLRCLDAHAHLGLMLFDSTPKYAVRHYETGFRIGEMSLGENFDGLLPWGWIDNRPFFRCMHGYGLCLWRLGKFEEAARVFERMLWLNPRDNQGARFLVEDARNGVAWEDREDA